MSSAAKWFPLFALLAVAGQAAAAVVVAQSIEQMTAQAPQVVRGKVAQRQARWNEGRRQIWTYTEILVTEHLKGQGPRTLLVRQPGGVIGEVGMRVSGAARFTEGEDVVLFLEPAAEEPGVFGLVGLGAGKVTLSRSHTGELRARRDLDGLAFYGQSPDVRLEPVGGNDLGTAEAFLFRVRKAAGGAR